MAVRTSKNGPAMRKSAFKWVSLVLIVYCLFYSVHSTSPPSVQAPVASLSGTVYTFFSYWLQICHEQATKLETWRYLSSVAQFDVVQPRSVCPLTCPMEQKRRLCGCLVARAEIGNSTRGYSTPSFPFNMLPGRVETSCQDFTGYALERCTADVRTRTQLFIALAVIFSMVLFCVVLISILTCIRRIKARRTVHPAIPTRKKPKKTPRTLNPGDKRRGDRDLGDRPHGRDNRVQQSLNDDDAVEAEEQGIADQDIPVTLDGMTDGWMQWIRQRANMHLPRNPSPKPARSNQPPPVRPGSAPGHTPRIPSLKLPKPTLSTFRKTGGLDPDSTRPSSQRAKGKGKGKESLRVRWDGTV